MAPFAPLAMPTVRRAVKIWFIRTASQTLIAMKFFSLRPANFPPNRNVALHAGSLGQP